MKSIRILLVDDHKIIRDGIKSYFTEDSNYTIVDEASNGQMALLKLEQISEEIDLVISDISMDVMDGIEFTKQISKKFPHVKVLIMSMLLDSKTIKTVLKAGTAGYLVKDSTEYEIKEAINLIMKGETYFSKQVTQIIMEGMRKRRIPNSIVNDRIKISKRETEIIQLISEEYSNQEIAERLFISVRTVDSHKRNLLEKTGSKNIIGLIKYAINNDLLEEFKVA
ncbi:response regulator transcription factor [Flexithrix dorotheae]|uniref:response regulator transcription factor n=1 Tax=Flexithrix dorotheae TaxID=70993 RepID=UPI00037D2F1A|nr:response regulator transcription factor [Flexithrix dorotheae]